MKVTDLMIGDWVKVPDGDKWFFGIVCGIDRDNVLVVKPWKSIAYPYEEECLEPIPLTKEILIRNGWREESDYENDLYGGHFPEDKEHRLELDVDGCEIWWTINCAENYIIHLRYVHELQHAFKLCGIDKEITL